MMMIFFLGMSRGELVDTLARLTVHNDEELRGLACQGLQNLVIDFPDWREDVLYGFMQFVVKVSVFLVVLRFWSFKIGKVKKQFDL